MRYKTIDFLRGVALITIILIHSLVPYLNNFLIHQVWNLAQFAVQIFIFCSGYLFFTRELKSDEKINIPYIVKRLRRLLIPYYIYVIIFSITLYMTHPSAFSWNFVLQSLTMTGGVDIGWLVLLFIQLTFILLFLKYCLKNNKVLFLIYVLISLLSSILLLIFKFPMNYKMIMWLPWALILIYSYYFKTYESHPKQLFIMCLTALFTFAFSSVYLIYSHKPLVFFDNKYPPNIFYLSYGLLFIPLLYTIGLKLKNIAAIGFYSRNSYSLYFIHYLVIYIFSLLKWPQYMPAVLFFIIVFSISSLIQLCFNKIRTFSV